MYFDEVIANERDLEGALYYYSNQAKDGSPVYQIGVDLNAVVHSRPNYTEQARSRAKELLKAYKKKWPKVVRTKGKEPERVLQPIVISNNQGNSTTNITNYHADIGNKRKQNEEVVTQGHCQKKTRPVVPVDEEDVFWDKWIEFIKKSRANPNLHEFACERNNVLRLGYGIVNANLSDEDYKDLKDILLETSMNYIPDVIEDVEAHLYEIFDILKNWNRCSFWESGLVNLESLLYITNIDDLLYKIKWPELNNEDAGYMSRLELVQQVTISTFKFAYKQNLASSLEQSYRDVLIYPLLKACVNIFNNNNLVFIPGEVPLNSMTAQLTNSKKVLAPNEKYYADGIVLFMNNEICIYEASGPFGAKEKSKQNFDFHKALYGLLSCITTIAQSYSYASLTTFSKLKLYFVQTKGSAINLWYLRHLKDNTYAIVRESKLNLSNEKEKYADTVLDCLQFVGLFKNRLSNTMGVINESITEHSKMSVIRRTRRATAVESPPQPLLSAIIKPTIIKLTESKHSKDMHKLGPDSFLGEPLLLES